MNRTITIEHGGTTYTGEVMRIKRTFLGYEDHGILTVTLHCEGKGSGVGVGGYCLDQPKQRGGTDFSRRGTAYGLDHIIRIMETAGVESWEKLPGTDIVTLTEGSGSGWGKSCVGVAGLLNDKVLIFAEHADAWKDAEKE